MRSQEDRDFFHRFTLPTPSYTVGWLMACILLFVSRTFLTI